MTLSIAFMFVLLLVVVGVFIWDKFPMDLVALFVVGVLALSGIITPKEAVSGFGNSLVIMIAGLFVVGEALMTTGVANAAGNWLLKVGGHGEARLLLFLLPLVAFLSAFMSSTGAVALLIPIVLSLARKSTMRRGLLFMPLSFAAMIGGMLTLIGTPPNIVVSSQMAAAGLGSFGFFDFTPIGLAILLAGIAYLVFVARWLLPKDRLDDDQQQGKTLNDFIAHYDISDQLHKLTILPESPLVGATVLDLKLRREFEVTPFALKHATHATTLLPIMLNTRMEKGDTLWVYGKPEHIEAFCQEQHLVQHESTPAEMQHLYRQFGFAEVMIPPESKHAGQALKQARFRENYGLNVIGLRRNQHPERLVFTESELQAGDTLLLAGGWAHVRRLGNNRDLIALETPAELEEVPIHDGKAPIALTIMALMLVVMTAGWLPNLTAIIVAALAMIATGCITLKETYRAINVPSLVLIAGLLPMAKAMDKSGAATYLVEHLVSVFNDASPLFMCGMFFVLTSLLSQFISNTATTVLLAPIALQTANLLGYQPEPFMMTVAIAASTAFATPIASPINLLVLSPGGYKFTDFVKVGIPLQLLAMVITLLLTPMLFPF